MPFERLSSSLFFAISILSVLAEVLGVELFAQIAIAGTVLYLALEFKHIKRLAKLIGGILFMVGVVFAMIDDNLGHLLYTGVRKTLPFLLLFASVTWLQAPSNYSPALLSVRQYVVQQPAGRRFFFLSFASHLLGAAFNLASFSLLSPMVRNVSDSLLQSRLVRAISFGFGTATCWSPFFVGTMIVISLTDGVDWVDVAPYGFAMALGLLLLGWVLDRLYFKRATAEPASPTEMPTFDGLKFARTLLVLITLFACVIIVSELFRWTISISLAVVAPVFSIIWLYTITRRQNNNQNNGQDKGLPAILYNDIFKGFRSLRGETFLFTSANIFGACFSDFIQQTPLDVQAHLNGLSPHLILSLIMVAFLLISAIGLHPVIFVIVLSSIFTPENTGIPPIIFALALITMWGQGTNVSPLSATIIYLSSVTGKSNFKIAWNWNSGFSLYATVILMIILNILLAIAH